MKAEEIWSIWDEVVGVDMGFDPVPFANAILDAVPTVGIEHVAQVLACEIECSIFEQHVAPAIETARKALAAPTQGADAQFIAEHGHRLAELLKLDYYDIADRDAQITMLLANKLPQPSQGADARPVAIYLGRTEISTGGEAWVELDEHERATWMDTVRIVYATRDAAPVVDARPVASAEEPVLWWNGFRKDDDERAGLSGPSYSPVENTWHDIPLYAGVNPCNLDARDAEIERLNAIINTPHADDFVRAVSIEAEHQRQRWGAEGDAGKTPADWFWLVGYLAGKALHSHTAGNVEKGEHHIITTAAACANWHRALFGKTDMRPGHEKGTAMIAAIAPMEKT